MWVDWDSKGINTACPLFSKFIHNHNRPDDDNQHPPQGGASEPQQVVDGKTGCSQSALTMHISGKLTGRQKQQRYPLARGSNQLSWDKSQFEWITHVT